MIDADHTVAGKVGDARMVGSGQLKIIKTDHHGRDARMRRLCVLKQQPLFRSQSRAQRGVHYGPMLSGFGSSSFKCRCIDAMIEKGVADEEQIGIARDADAFELSVVREPMAPGHKHAIESQQYHGCGEENGRQRASLHGLKIYVDKLRRLAAEGVDEKDGCSPHGTARQPCPIAPQEGGRIIALATEVFDSGTQVCEHQPSRSLL
jgi:hypothetical protein